MTPGDRLFRELEVSNWWVSIPQIEAFIAGVNRVVAEEVAKERERCARFACQPGDRDPLGCQVAKLIREGK